MSTQSPTDQISASVLSVNDDLPIRTDKPVHSGKVRSVYWLTEADSRRLIREKGYPVAEDAPLAIMVISDRISAFDCIWRGEGMFEGCRAKALRSMRYRITGSACSRTMAWPIAIFWIFHTHWYGLCKKQNRS